MNSLEKADMLKSTIEKLYTCEGRSITYISDLLEINRKVLSGKIKKEWRLTEPEPRRHASASTRKYINRNRERILSMLNRDVSDNDIASALGISRDFLSRTVIPADKTLSQAKDARITRANDAHAQRHIERMVKSNLDYDNHDLPDEVWAPILGYKGYQVSNMGRIRHHVEEYNAYVLLKQTANKNSRHLYVRIGTDDATTKKHNLLVARLVAFAFCPNHSAERNTVNHKNGDIADNRAENLEWVLQSENNKRSYDYLGRKHANTRRYRFDHIVYQDKYRFSTVAAFARFIGKSETQARHYLDEPEKHRISFV